MFYRKDRIIQIQGLQKLTLLDFPGKVACTVFTGGCNFRCPFCHNASLVTHLSDAPALEETELFSYLARRKGILDGVCITGGEPLLQKDIGEFCDRVHELGFSIKLDTNGSFPNRLEALIAKKRIDYIAMDIKNSKEAYAETCGLTQFPEGVEDSIRLILSCGLPYEFRTTVVKEFHTEERIRSITKWIKGAEQYFLQAFTDSGDLIGSGLSACSATEMEDLLVVAQETLPCTKLRGI